MGEFEEIAEQAGEAFIAGDEAALDNEMHVDALASESAVDAATQTEGYDADYPQVLNPEFLSGGPQV